MLQRIIQLEHASHTLRLGTHITLGSAILFCVRQSARVLWATDVGGKDRCGCIAVGQPAFAETAAVIEDDGRFETQSLLSGGEESNFHL